jgi:hypothetical protein
MLSPVMLSLPQVTVSHSAVLINLIFNTCSGSIIRHIGKFYFKDFLNCNFKLYENWQYRSDFSLELRIIKVFKITR